MPFGAEKHTEVGTPDWLLQCACFVWLKHVTRVLFGPIRARLLSQVLGKKKRTSKHKCFFDTWFKTDFRGRGLDVFFQLFHFSRTATSVSPHIYSPMIWNHNKGRQLLLRGCCTGYHPPPLRRPKGKRCVQVWLDCQPFFGKVLREWTLHFCPYLNRSS